MSILEKNNTFYYVQLCNEEQTEEICLEAVKHNGLLLRYVKEQTKEICLEAVKEDERALQIVEEQTEEICLESVKKNGGSLQFVKKQTEQICLEAIKQNVNSLQFVKEKTEQICLEFDKKNDEIFISSCQKNYCEIVKIMCDSCDKYVVVIEDNKIVKWYVKFTPYERKQIDKDIEECPICMEVQSNIITDCNHQLCLECCQHIYKTKTCHICRHDISDFFIIEPKE
jgi:hypothetical protein